MSMSPCCSEGSSALSSVDSLNYDFSFPTPRPKEPTPVALATERVPFLDGGALMLCIMKVLSRVGMMCVKEWNVLGDGELWEVVQDKERRVKWVWSQRVHDLLLLPLQVVESMIEGFRREVDIYAWRARYYAFKTHSEIEEIFSLRPRPSRHELRTILRETFQYCGPIDEYYVKSFEYFPRWLEQPMNELGRLERLLESAITESQDGNGKSEMRGGVEEGLRSLEALGESSNDGIPDEGEEKKDDGEADVEREARKTNAERIFEAYRDPKNGLDAKNPTNYSALPLIPPTSLSSSLDKGKSKPGTDASNFVDHMRQAYPLQHCQINSMERVVLKEMLRKVRRVERKAMNVVEDCTDNRRFLRKIGLLWEEDGGKEWCR